LRSGQRDRVSAARCLTSTQAAEARPHGGARDRGRCRRDQPARRGRREPAALSSLCRQAPDSAARRGSARRAGSRVTHPGEPPLLKAVRAPGGGGLAITRRPACSTHGGLPRADAVAGSWGGSAARVVTRMRTGGVCTASGSRASMGCRPPEGDRMRRYAKMSSGPEPVPEHGSEGRHSKASTPPGQDSSGSLAAEPAEGAPSEAGPGEPGNETVISPLPRRVAGLSGGVAHPAGPPGVIGRARVSGGPPWEPAPEPPGTWYTPRHRASP
jgi:hypothetical protein